MQIRRSRGSALGGRALCALEAMGHDEFDFMCATRKLNERSGATRFDCCGGFYPRECNAILAHDGGPFVSAEAARIKG